MVRLVMTFQVVLSMIPLFGMAQAPNLKIGLLADIQYSDCETSGTRHYRLSLGKTEEAVGQLLAEKVDLTVILGDMIDRDISNFTPVRALLEPLNPNLLLIPGNHDFALGKGDEANRIRKELMDLLPEARIMGGMRLLFLNGMANSIEGWPDGSRKQAKGLATYKRLKESGAPNAQEWNGGLGKKQLNWIQQQVKDANRHHQSLILFCHLPALPGDAHSLWDTEELLLILGQSENQVLFLCGHKHSGGDDLTGNCRILNLKGMVEGTGNAYGILEIFDDRWVLKGYGNQESYSGSRE